MAIDASMAIYQFLIAVRSSDGAQLTNESGETTRYLTDDLPSWLFVDHLYVIFTD